MKHLSIFVFVSSFCVALVYLTLQSESGKAWLTSWNTSPGDSQSKSIGIKEAQVNIELKRQVDTLRLQIAEQDKTIIAMQALIAQLTEQVSLVSVKASAKEKQIASQSELLLPTSTQPDKLIQNANREHLARLQDVVSKMEMTSLRALSN